MILESNERYDIVSKATSDTIWDWKIQEDDLVWNKGIQDVLVTIRRRGKTSKWCLTEFIRRQHQNVDKTVFIY